MWRLARFFFPESGDEADDANDSEASFFEESDIETIKRGDSFLMETDDEQLPPPLCPAPPLNTGVALILLLSRPGQAQ